MNKLLSYSLAWINCNYLPLFLGDLTWTDYPSMSDDQYICSGTTSRLIWNFTTNESVLSISWYKQPGNISVADYNFNKFTPSNKYTGRVSHYLNSTYMAAIELTNVTEADGGNYTCTVQTTNANTQHGHVIYARMYNAPF